MKKLKVLLVALLVALPFLALTASSRAQSVYTGNTVSIPSTETIDSAVYATGQTVTIDATINGDLYCAGQTVTISGTINGDILCAAQTLTIAGRVNGDVRLAGQTVALNDLVTGNASVAAQTLTSDRRAIIGRDITVMAQSATFNASIGRDIAGNAEQMTINNAVGRNVVVQVNRLTLGGISSVGGGIFYTSWQELQRQGDAKVAGEIRRTTPRQPPTESQRFAVWGVAVWLLLSMFVLSLALVLLAPRLFQAGSTLAQSSLGITFLVGFAATVIVPVIIMGLLITAIGIPLGLLLLFAWLIVLGISGPLAAYLLGRMIWRGGTNAVLIMLFGTIIIIALSLIPVINFFVVLAVIWFGVGIALRLLWHLFGKRTYAVSPARTATTTEIDEFDLEKQSAKKKKAP